MENSYFHGKIQESVNNLKDRLTEIKGDISELKKTYNKDRLKYIEEITELKTKVRFIAGMWGALISVIIALASILIQKFI